MPLTRNCKTRALGKFRTCRVTRLVLSENSSSLRAHQELEHLRPQVLGSFKRACRNGALDLSVNDLLPEHPLGLSPRVRLLVTQENLRGFLAQPLQARDVASHECNEDCLGLQDRSRAITKDRQKRSRTAAAFAAIN